MKEKKTVSIIGQCYNEQEMIPVYYREICKVIDQIHDMDFEIIIVDDASTDQSLSILKSLANEDSRIKCLSMSRNCGKAACCIAGMQYAAGDYVVTMDIDLQDPPKLLPDMINIIQRENVDIIATLATTRTGYSAFHKLCTKCFYSIFNSISSVKIKDGQRDYRLMTRQVVDAILLHKEYNLFDKGYFTDVGFRTKWITFENVERPAGDTKWPFKRLLKFSIIGIIGYSITPLKMIFGLGVIELIGAFALAIAAAVNNCLSGGSEFALWSAAAIVGLFGLQMTALGIVAAYIAQIHTEVKLRPRFIVRETVNFNNKDREK